jgi:hypothetical protein
MYWTRVGRECIIDEERSRTLFLVDGKGKEAHCFSAVFS